MSGHLYWSINITDAGDGSPSFVSVVALELREILDGAVATDSIAFTASATSSTSLFPASNAFDNDLSTAWISGAWSPPERLTVQFASPVSIIQHTLRTRASSYNQDPNTWTLEYSDDGISWTVDNQIVNYTFVDQIGTFINDGQLYLTPVASPSSIGQIHVVDASAVSVTGTANATVRQIQTIPPPSPLFSTPTIPPVNLPVVQSVSANALSSTHSITPANVSQIHSIQSITLTSTPSVSQGTSITLFDVMAIELSITPVLDAANIAQQHVVSASGVWCYSWLDVMDKKYLGVTYSTENHSITTYSNFEFTGSCLFGDKTLLVNGNGLYEYGGYSDDGFAIVASIKTGKMNQASGNNGTYQSNKIKRIPDAKIYIDADKAGGEVLASVTADNVTYPYANSIAHDGFATHRVAIGRGIKYNYIQLELTGRGCSKIDLSSIEFTPAETVRSER
jgi:hypothetical protein